MPRHRASPEPPAEGWCVYFLRCGDGSLYAGCTNRLPQRLGRHGSGRGAAYTRSHRPVTLVWWEPAADRSAALRREAALKRLSRTEKLALIGKGAATYASASRRPAAGARRARSAP